MEPRQSLSEIMRGNQLKALKDAFSKAETAEESGTPIPAGVYLARIIHSEIHTAKTGTNSYRLTFKIGEGEYADRLLWLDLWLTEAAVAQTKRDLGKLGITSLEQLEKPFPKGIRAEIRVTLRKDDNGEEFNRVKSFKVIGIDPAEENPFAPAPGGGDGEPPKIINASVAAMPDDNGGREALDEIGSVEFPFGNNVKPNEGGSYYEHE